mmetsp:Transcript_23943/g.36667  ORF Transcript_23943/g.36667 Transcript_23943/m.36667 type:complete len:130 (-) Transcript_23943:1074-1463(-)
MYESEALRLQREADNFTKKFEHEKKRLMILEDQYKQACEELVEKQAQLKTVRPATAKVKKDVAMVKTMENQLEQNNVKYNNLQAENKNLRRQIDMMRKEMKNQIRVNQVYSKELKHTNDKAKKLNASSY